MVRSVSVAFVAAVDVAAVIVAVVVVVVVDGLHLFVVVVVVVVVLGGGGPVVRPETDISCRIPWTICMPAAYSLSSSSRVRSCKSRSGQTSTLGY